MILVLRALGLGDLLTAVPALRALRSSFPDEHLVLAAPAVQQPLLRWIGAVDELLPTPGLAPLTDRPRVAQPNLAVNLHGCGPQSTDVLRALQPEQLLAFGEDIPWRDEEHEVDRWCRLIGSCGIATDPDDLYLQPPSGRLSATGERDRTALIHPGASSEARRWPAERFAAVAAALAQQGWTIEVSGGPTEAALVSNVVELARSSAGSEIGAPIRRHLGADLGELAQRVATCRLVVVGDTGVAHLASALQTPSVVLFGPTSPATWGPRDLSRHTVLWSGHLGDPHGVEPDPGLLDVTVEQVLGAIASRAGGLTFPQRAPRDNVWP